MRRLLAALCLCLAALPARAEPEALPDGVGRVALIEGWRQPDGTHVAAIEISLDPGWRTYWRVPGASGIPPTFDWSASRNLAAVSYEWPRPRIFDRAGAPYFGYEDELVLPIRLTPRHGDQPIEAVLEMEFGVCSDICVPAVTHVDARLRADAPPRGRLRIDRALAERAISSREAGIAGVTCALQPQEDGFAILAQIDMAEAPAAGQVAIIETGTPELHLGTPEVRTRGRQVLARAPVLAGAAAPWLDRDALRITLLDDRRAVDIRGCGAPG